MRASLSIPGRRRDPYWGMEGRGARRERRMRRVLKVLLLLAFVVLTLTVLRPMAAQALANYPDASGWISAAIVVVSDPVKIVGAILLGAAVATLAAYLRIRRSRATHR